MGSLLVFPLTRKSPLSGAAQRSLDFGPQRTYISSYLKAPRRVPHALGRGRAAQGSGVRRFRGGRVETPGSQRDAAAEAAAPAAQTEKRRAVSGVRAQPTQRQVQAVARRAVG